MSREKKSLFWASYADLMTSLFFIMLTLFVASSILLSKKGHEWEGLYRQSQSQKEQLERINDVIQDLDPTFFEYIGAYKKSKLVINANYGVDRFRPEELSQSVRDSLKKAGESLIAFVQSTSEKYPGVQYILIIEGQASRIGGTDHNYELSYRRAYYLKKFWEDNNIRFDALNCEVQISGSGDGVQSGTGLMREDSSRESLNQRFLIHILPKPGYVKIDSDLLAPTNAK